MKAPFFHDELVVKQQFLQLARDFHASEDIEKQLAAAILYANLSEYLAYHLAESLKQIIYSGSKSFWNGNVYLDLRDTTEKKTIGQIAIDLKEYGFPSKEIIIPLLESIAINRNKIMHKMLRTPSDQLAVIDGAIQELANDSEELILAIDDIYRGLPPVNITQTTIASSPTVSPKVEAVENDKGEITVQEKEDNTKGAANGAVKKRA